MKPASFEATPPMLFHQLFRQGKLEANIKQNYIYKTKFHCSPRTENQIISVKPSFTVRPARSVSLVLLEGCRSSCSKRVTRLARSVSLALLEACHSPRSKRVTRLARSVLLVLLGAYRSPRPKRVTRPARSVSLALLGGYISLHSEGASHSARRVHSTPLGGYTSLRSEGTPHSARRVHLTPHGGYISLRSEGAARPARRVLLVLLGAYRSPCPKRVTRLARSVPLALLEECRSLCSKDAARPAGSDAPMLFHQVFRQGKLEADRKPNYICKTKFHCPPCSEGAVPKVIMYASTIKSEKYFRNIGDKSRAGIGVHFVEYGVNFPLRKCHYCKSRF